MVHLNVLQAWRFNETFQMGVPEELDASSQQLAYVLPHEPTQRASNVKLHALLAPRQLVVLLILAKYARLQHIKSVLQRKQQEEKAKSVLAKLFGTNSTWFPWMKSRAQVAPDPSIPQHALRNAQLGSAPQVRSAVASTAQTWRTKASRAHASHQAAKKAGIVWKDRTARSMASLSNDSMPVSAATPVGCACHSSNGHSKQSGVDSPAPRESAISNAARAGTAVAEATKAPDVRSDTPGSSEHGEMEEASIVYSAPAQAGSAASSDDVQHHKQGVLARHHSASLQCSAPDTSSSWQLPHAAHASTQRMVRPAWAQPEADMVPNVRAQWHDAMTAAAEVPMLQPAFASVAGRPASAPVQHAQAEATRFLPTLRAQQDHQQQAGESFEHERLQLGDAEQPHGSPLGSSLQGQKRLGLLQARVQTLLTEQSVLLSSESGSSALNEQQAGQPVQTPAGSYVSDISQRQGTCAGAKGYSNKAGSYAAGQDDAATPSRTQSSLQGHAPASEWAKLRARGVSFLITSEQEQHNLRRAETKTSLRQRASVSIQQHSQSCPASRDGSMQHSRRSTGLGLQLLGKQGRLSLHKIVAAAREDPVVLAQQGFLKALARVERYHMSRLARKLQRRILALAQQRAQMQVDRGSASCSSCLLSKLATVVCGGISKRTKVSPLRSNCSALAPRSRHSVQGGIVAHRHFTRIDSEPLMTPVVACGLSQLDAQQACSDSEDSQTAEALDASAHAHEQAKLIAVASRFMATSQHSPHDHGRVSK